MFYSATACSLRARGSSLNTHVEVVHRSLCFQYYASVLASARPFFLILLSLFDFFRLYLDCSLLFWGDRTFDFHKRRRSLFLGSWTAVFQSLQHQQMSGESLGNSPPVLNNSAVIVQWSDLTGDRSRGRTSVCGGERQQPTDHNVDEVTVSWEVQLVHNMIR